MILRIIAVGKLKEKYWQKGVEEYVNRLRPYVRLEIVEVLEARTPEGARQAEKDVVMDQEAKTILERLNKTETLTIALDRKGKSFDSEELAKFLEVQILEGRKEITWIIGGPLGLAPSVIERADLVLSFSKLTFPHQMMRLILLEQIYRSFRIMRHEPYHR
ncbi:Ribosomal RNA large subunit methyltransferase H [uncultured archaeon]|nr:Ribosomal RNA large subunit methyltransferase H [uncultured archaeon]